MLAKNYFRLRDEIITYDIDCYGLILRYDDISLTACTFMAEMMIMPADPSVAMLALTKETQVIDFHNTLLIYAFIFSHVREYF